MTKTQSMEMVAHQYVKLKHFSLVQVNLLHVLIMVRLFVVTGELKLERPVMMVTLLTVMDVQVNV